MFKKTIQIFTGTYLVFNYSAFIFTSVISGCPTLYCEMWRQVMGLIFPVARLTQGLQYNIGMYINSFFLTLAVFLIILAWKGDVLNRKMKQLLLLFLVLTDLAFLLMASGNPAMTFVAVGVAYLAMRIAMKLPYAK